MRTTTRLFSSSKKKWTYTLGVVVLTLGLTTTANTSAMGTGSASGSQFPTAAVGINEDEEGDAGGFLVAYAKLHGISELRAAEQVATQEYLGDLTVELADRFSSSEFDLWIDVDGDIQVVNLRTSNDEIEEVVRAAAKTQRFELAVFQEDAFAVARTDRMDDELENLQQIGVEFDGAYVDVRTGDIVFDVPAATFDVDRAGTRQVEGLGSVRMVPHESGLSDQAYIRGGVALGSCTAAFTAYNSTYNGFLTAGHCGSSQSYWANISGSGSAAGTSTRRSQNYGANADIAFHSVKSTDTIVGRFHTVNSATTVATGANLTPTTGATVCRRGKTSGYGCGTITSTSYKPTWTNACPGVTCNSVFVSVSLTTRGGDSGGPWFSSNRPVGVHKGGGTGLSVYSKINYSPAYVTIKR